MLIPPLCQLKVYPHIPLQPVYQSASAQAASINRVSLYFFIAAAFIFLLVAGLVTYVLLRFRETENPNRPVTDISRKWEIPMIGIPLMMVGFFLYESIAVMKQVQPPAERTPDVVITGHQWWWEASYPGTDVITANEVHLPAGRLVLLRLLSADVIHDWWVPSLGAKADMVPGRTGHLWVTIREPGDYYGICSEFCGAQHAHMRIKVIAETPERFHHWLAAQERPAAAEAAVAQGRRLFIDKACGSCHSIRGTSASGRDGPDLTHMASRTTLLAGLLVNNNSNLRSWIQHPQRVKPLANMPDFLLDDTTAQNISDYLSTLQ